MGKSLPRAIKENGEKQMMKIRNVKGALLRAQQIKGSHEQLRKERKAVQFGKKYDAI